MPEPKGIEFFRFLLHGDRPNSDGEWRAFCPIHEDPEKSKTPSASFNFAAGDWYCHVCQKGGSIRSAKRDIENGELGKVKQAKTKAKEPEPDEGKPLPSKTVVAMWCKRLLKTPERRKYMDERRGLNVTTIRKYNIGWDGQRYTIPIYDEGGELVNIRRYRPTPKDRNVGNKMVSWGTGRGSARIYGFDTLKKAKEVILAEGELDRLVSCQHGLPTVTHTGGVMTWNPEWAAHFKDMDVYIAYDEDSKGDAGAARAASYLKNTAKNVYRIKLETGIEGGDLTDFFVGLGRTEADMRERMRKATPMYEAPKAREPAKQGKRVTIEESQNPAHREPIEIIAQVPGKQTPPYVVPTEIRGNCIPGSAGQACNVCPFAVNDGKIEASIDPDDPRLLDFINANDMNKKRILRELTGARCERHVSFEDITTVAVEQLIVSPSVEHRSEEAETPISRSVYNVGKYATPVNQLVRMVCQQVPDPRSQRGVLHAWHSEPIQSDIAKFAMTPARIKRLRQFRRGNKQPLDRCFEIAEDMAASVTGIYGRELMHVAYDLVWHSVIGFMFEGKPVTKGWLECLVIGDPRTGKSESATALAKHYGSGTVRSCETATLAGLIGGVQQMDRNTKWMVTWGELPLNDRRLVVLDEMSGLFNGKSDKGILENMSSIRSEGKAQITKIEGGETSARTRIIWITNPKNGKLSEIPGGGITAIERLIGAPEDIARFDFALACSENEVPSSVINRRHVRARPKFSTSASHDLIMWVWSRRADQIVWDNGTEEYVYAAAEALGSKYVSSPPLVQIANARLKIARVAVALAARTFSASADGENIVVKRMHVRDAVRFLDMCYESDAMGYGRASRREHENEKRARKAREEAVKWLKHDEQRTVIEVLNAVGADDYHRNSFTDFGMDEDDAGLVIRKLIGWRMIHRVRNKSGMLRHSQSLVEILNELEDEG